MQGLDAKKNTDTVLLDAFTRQVLEKVPHPVSGDGDKVKIMNPTPLVDLTSDLIECARTEYSLNLDQKNLRVFGKLDSAILTGSIKVRPAVKIIHEAIASGQLRKGQTIIEATSGNFGIALGHFVGLGLRVVSLVSRKLQEGVFEELRNENISIVNLDMDICPAPGMKGNASAAMARATAANLRAQLVELGFDPAVFDANLQGAEALLVEQDIINLAKHLARIYNCFCPEQYDNELNVMAHKETTGPELDQQLEGLGAGTLEDYRIICTFGTGGTSGGLSRYCSEKYGKKAVHVVFPRAGQDVAGIRTKSKAEGLRFYEPDRYSGQTEVDFEQAKPLLKFFVKKGYDIGESSALALYAAMQMANFGMANNFVVIIADGIKKYRKAFEAMEEEESAGSLEVELDRAHTDIKKYDKVVWIHTMYTPREEGVRLIAESLGVDPSKIIIPKAKTVERMLMTQKVPDELESVLGGRGEGKTLLVCMMGNTSLMAAQVMSSKGIKAQSLSGGISALSEGKGKQLPQLVKMATE